MRASTARTHSAARAREHSAAVHSRFRRTVDLAFILSRFGVRFRFLTRTLGANPAYSHEAFYLPTLDKDMQRVNDLFDAAAKHSIVIERRSISPGQLQELMRRNDNLVVALVDRRLLYRASRSGVSSIVGNVLSHCLAAGAGYVGHYILITGLDDDEQGYVIKDPGGAGDSCVVSCDDLDDARRSHGTDEDLLVIPWAQPKMLVAG